MANENICPNCKQDTEVGAAFCGNCGYKLTSTQPTVVAQTYSNGPAPATSNSMPLTPATPIGPSVPAYAIPRPHHKQHWAAMALAFGILGLGGGLLIPILGIAFGVTGIVLVTASFSATSNWLRITSLVVSILAVLIALGVWVDAVAHDTKLHSTSSQAGSANGVATISVTTPCYSLTFSTELNVNNSSGSCSVNAYNNSSFQDSSDVFKVVASQTNASATDFAAYAKQAITQDIAKNLTGFQVTNQASNLFDGSPAYYIEGINPSNNVDFIEEAILHNSSSSVRSDNLFVIVHAVSGQSANLNLIEKSWQWND